MEFCGAQRTPSSEDSTYLEGPQDELKDHFHLRLKGVREEGKHNVVYSKQGNKQKCRLSQSPEDKGVWAVGMGPTEVATTKPRLLSVGI